MIKITTQTGQIIPIEEVERIEAELLAIKSTPTTDEVLDNLITTLVDKGVLY